MRKFLLGTAAIALAALGSHAFAESRLPRGLVGFTTATTTGDAGVLAMTKLCQAEFPASRMCTSLEVLTTQAVPILPDAGAWVQPTFSPAGVAGTMNLVVGTDASGGGVPPDNHLSEPHNFSCIGWSHSVARGMVVDDHGRFLSADCSTTQRVACCAGQPELLGDIDRDGDLDLADSTLIRRFLAGEVSALPG